MPDIVVTVPKNFEYYDPKTKRELKGIEGWIAEGDVAGEPWSGEEWHFYLGGPRPTIMPGERVYVVHNGKLRGYSPLIRIEDYRGYIDVNGEYRGGSYSLVRHGDAVAVTIDAEMVGFRGFRYRWWSYDQERPFPDWKTP